MRRIEREQRSRHFNASRILQQWATVFTLRTATERRGFMLLAHCETTFVPDLRVTKCCVTVTRRRRQLDAMAV